MNVQIFRHDKEWIVLTESYALSFHQTLAGAMDHAAAEIGASNDHGTSSKSNPASYNS
ncbi:hypothetical protein [uncultured Mediterranean phage uvMED]|nr:hypothetical protein [uncultured Mediterranean phage uvMED]